MDRFLEILREEMNKQFSIGGAFANKNTAMQSFDKASTKALIRYAREKGIDLT